MELLVLPNLKDNEKKIATDELPTSGKGKTITTVEPKFVPKEAALLRLPDQTELKVRLAGLRGLSCDRSRRHHGEGKAPHGKNALGGRRDAL